jgi:hypothetical protein
MCAALHGKLSGVIEKQYGGDLPAASWREECTILKNNLWRRQQTGNQMSCPPRVDIESKRRIPPVPEREAPESRRADRHRKGETPRESSSAPLITHLQWPWDVEGRDAMAPLGQRLRNAGRDVALFAIVKVGDVQSLSFVRHRSPRSAPASGRRLESCCRAGE